jgi:hypothetical protein
MVAEPFVNLERIHAMSLPLTETQIIALERAAFEQMEISIPRGAEGTESIVTQAEQWISHEIDYHMGTACAQTRLSIAVTTLIGGE